MGSRRSAAISSPRDWISGASARTAVMMSAAANGVRVLSVDVAEVRREYFNTEATEKHRGLRQAGPAAVLCAL